LFLYSVRRAVAAAEEARSTLIAQQSTQGGSTAVTGLLQAAKKGGRLASAGIVGRLGDLATISPEYDTAIRLTLYLYLINQSINHILSLMFVQSICGCIFVM
jgi:chromosome segregation ATPase